MSEDRYQNPLIARYASDEMAQLWSSQRKFSTWRRMWIALAESQQALGLDISDAQLDELRSQVDQIDFEAAGQYERKLRHDVMAHVHAYADVCPQARPIIHLGATSCFVTDNTDLILLREALELIRSRLVSVIGRLAEFAAKQRSQACLGFTHMQPAQPTTIGKRACLWIYDLVLDLQEMQHRIELLKARSCKGTTGTQASFLKLFSGDHDKVNQLEGLVAEKMGFSATYAVTGQTYSRKIDAQVLDALSGISQSAHKAATDIRILASRKELEEPFEKHQIGSSAMAYKRNPMRSERICSLARFVMSLQSSGSQTVATQWMERTLDDSANRRLVLPQSFLAVDAVLILYQNIATGLVPYPAVMENNLQNELPFMATENILMEAVAAGGDRQQLHEQIRQHSQEAASVVKQEGRPNDLLQRLAEDELFASVDLASLMEASQFVGRAPEQVEQFLAEVVKPIQQQFPEADMDAEVTV
ncbi:MAG: adenylosuccinate lyase [Planctomycetota bacterium]|nr:adenylosuccinate lyase [Planctomycetota bacterium]